MDFSTTLCIQGKIGQSSHCSVLNGWHLDTWHQSSCNRHNMQLILLLKRRSLADNWHVVENDEVEFYLMFFCVVTSWKWWSNHTKGKCTLNFLLFQSIHSPNFSIPSFRNTYCTIKKKLFGIFMTNVILWHIYYNNISIFHGRLVLWCAEIMSNENEKEAFQHFFLQYASNTTSIIKYVIIREDLLYKASIGCMNYVSESLLNGDPKLTFPRLTYVHLF